MVALAVHRCFGVLEAASGLAKCISQHLAAPRRAAPDERRTQIELAGSALLIPHSAALARFGAGGVLMAVAAWHEGFALASVALIPLVLALAWLILVISAAFARVALIRPEVDVVQVSVRWGGPSESSSREPQRRRASVSLSISTVSAAKLLDPTVLYQPELAPSLGALLAVLTAAATAGVLVYLLWSGRVAATARAEQQREAEEHA